MADWIARVVARRAPNAVRCADMEEYEFSGGALNHALALMDRHASAPPVVLTDGAEELFRDLDDGVLTVEE